jgi:hypothetical protein
VTQSTYVESVPSSPGSAPSSASSSSLEPTPALPTDANIPGERSLQQTDKPITPAPGADTGAHNSGVPGTPGSTPGNTTTSPTTPANSTDGGATTPADESSTNFQAPQLLDPKGDRTVEHHRAPVWTAVYHKVDGAASHVQPVSHSRAIGGAEQEQLDAAGWSSAAGN